MSELKDAPQVEPTRVGVSVGYKMNLGNFENADVHISVSTSARPGETAGDQVDRVFSLVEAKLVEKFNEMKAELTEAGLGEAR